MSRLLLHVVGLLALSFLATVVLLVAASRVGDDAPTTFGAERSVFEANWGGPLAQSLPRFWLERDVLRTRVVTGQRVESTEIVETPLVPVDAVFDITLEHGTQKQGWLSFQAYEAREAAEFVVENTTGFPGQLKVRVDTPGGSVLVHDYTLRVGDTQVRAPVLGGAIGLLELAPGESVRVALTLASNGTDRFALLLSDWSGGLVPHFRATLRVDTDRFALLRYGLPHERTNADGGSTVVFDVTQFSAAQDVGVTFVNDEADFSRVSDLMDTSPLAAALLLFGTFVWAQVRGLRIGFLRWAFLAMVHTFYFCFVSYLVRYTTLGPATATALVLCTGSFAVTIPPAFGYTFAWRTMYPLFLALTVGYTLVFLVPVFKGLAVLAFFFVGFMALVAPLARSDVSKWPVVADDPRTGAIDPTLPVGAAP